jgi:hypothetical protein
MADGETIIAYSMKRTKPNAAERARAQLSR